MGRCYKSHTLTQLLLESLQEEMDYMSEAMLSTLQYHLLTAVSMLRTSVNIRRPLFSLPVEVLAQILDKIPAPKQAMKRDSEWSVARFWNPSLGDSTLLVAPSQTCRRLRNIALSRPSWWRYIKSTDDIAMPAMVSRSEQQPLELVIQGHEGQTNCLHESYPTMTPRMHRFFLHVDYARMSAFESFLQLVHPELEALSCCASDPYNAGWDRFKVILSREYFPRIRQLVVEGIRFRAVSPFPALTHLILSRIFMRGLHAQVVLLLNSSPELETLVLSRIYDSDATEEHEPPPLPRLRRIVLDDLTNPSVRLYLPLTSLCSEEAALQISNSACDGFVCEPMLSERMGERVQTFLGIAVSRRADGDHSVSVTLASAVSAIRIEWTTYLISVSQYKFPGVWLAAVLADKARLAGLQELWLVQVSSYFTESSRPHLAAIIGSLRTLKTVTFVDMDDTDDNEDTVLRAPDLAYLPNAIDNPSFGQGCLKTLRVIQCSRSTTSGSREMGVERRRKLDFSHMLLKLVSKAYSYLQNLEIEVMPRFYVDKEEVEMLGRYLKRVSVVTINDPPRMPLPPCCADDDETSGGSWTKTMF